MVTFWEKITFCADNTQIRWGVFFIHQPIKIKPVLAMVHH